MGKLLSDETTDSFLVHERRLSVRGWEDYRHLSLGRLARLRIEQAEMERACWIVGAVVLALGLAALHNDSAVLR